MRSCEKALPVRKGSWSELEEEAYISGRQKLSFRLRGRKGLSEQVVLLLTDIAKDFRQRFQLPGADANTVI